MKKIVLAAVLAALGSTSALAADLGARTYTKAPALADPTSNWSGFYIGANGGWGWSNLSATANPFGVDAILDIAPQSLSAGANGAMFGGQIGYNWQAGRFLIGIEGDFDGAAISRTQSHVFGSGLAAAGTDSFTANERINWLASVRGRVGYTWGPSLLYVTGGGAWKNSTVDATISSNTGPGGVGESATGSFSQTTSGWVVGAGYEWMIQPNWTVRGEYLHYDFKGGNSNALTLPNCESGGACGVNVSTGRNEIDAFRLGVNYKFGAELGSASAFAADLGTRTYTKAPALADPAANWSGFYIGANGGWGRTDLSSTANPFGVTAILDIAPQSLSAGADGALFGGQIGYNWQAGRFLIGIEGDFDGATISRTQSHVFESGLFAPATNSFTANERINWLASVRGRVGYTWGPSLLYVTGGGAWKNSTVDATISSNAGNGIIGESATGSFSQTTSGWVVGAGYEWMIQPNWTVRGEYLHYDFKGGNSNALTLPRCGGGEACGVNVSTGRNEIDAFRLGVNYKFGG